MSLYNILVLDCVCACIGPYIHVCVCVYCLLHAVRLNFQQFKFFMDYIKEKPVRLLIFCGKLYSKQVLQLANCIEHHDEDDNENIYEPVKQNSN